MRFIDRSSLEPPKILTSERTEQARQEVQSFIRQTYEKGGTRRTPSSAWLMQHESFRDEVQHLFDNRCAYCEKHTPDKSISSPDGGVVSHHRPESLAEDEKGRTDLTAYSWLMYNWENILWVCNDCERRKSNRFFVQSRRGNVGDDIEQLRRNEGELILDPCFHFPAEHLHFKYDGMVSGNTEEGKTTIELLDLNQTELVKARSRNTEALVNCIVHEIDSLEVASSSENLDGNRSVFEFTAGSITGRMLEKTDGQFKHSGAATLAVLALARKFGMKAENAPDFMDELSEDIQMMFLEFQERGFPEQQASAGIEPEKSPPEESAAKDTEPSSDIKRAKSDRTLSINELPAALSPISKVEISNFKTLRDITFDLPTTVADPDQSPCMILLGENGTGKSSVLEAMALAVIGADEADELNKLLKDEDLSPADLIHRPDPSKWDEPHDRLDIRLNFIDREEQIHLHAEKGDKRFSGSEQGCKVVLGYGPRRFFTNRKTRRYRAPAQRVRSLFDPLDMIANPIHWLADLDDDNFYAAARALREILMLDEEDDFERDDDDNTRGQIFIKQHGQRTALKDLSVGYKSVIAMACDIIRELLYHFDNVEFAHAVVFIDEIETHLHPRWKLQIMQLLRKAFPKVQLIVTTHDPLCLRGMYEGEVFVLQRNITDSQVEKIEDLPSIRGMRAEQILTSEFFGLGSTDPETDAQLARYNMLAARQEDLDDSENEELNRLRVQLDDNMIIGSTLAEQAYADVLKEQVKEQVQLTKVQSPRRDRLKARFSTLFDKSDAS